MTRTFTTSVAGRTVEPRPATTRQDMLCPEGVRIRDGFGLLTIDETAERYGIDPERIAAAILAEEVGCVTFTFKEDTQLELLPTNDGAVAEWLEARG